MDDSDDGFAAEDPRPLLPRVGLEHASDAVKHHAHGLAPREGLENHRRLGDPNSCIPVSSRLLQKPSFIPHSEAFLHSEERKSVQRSFNNSMSTQLATARKRASRGPSRGRNPTPSQETGPPPGASGRPAPPPFSFSRLMLGSNHFREASATLCRRRILFSCSSSIFLFSPLSPQKMNMMPP